MTLFKRLFSVLLAVCFANGVMIQTAQAALVSTEQVARVAATDASAHQRLNDKIGRAHV